jgi:hypothetical protein
VGCEIDKDYFKAQEERFAAHTSQSSLFVSTPPQVAMFTEEAIT